jgi:hypothetical protein
MQVAAPAVMTAKHGTDNQRGWRNRHQAEAGVAFEKEGDGLDAVGLIETDAFRILPQGEHGAVVGD